MAGVSSDPEKRVLSRIEDLGSTSARDRSRIFLDEHTSWRFFEGLEEVDPSWKELGFVDEHWKRGRGTMGYGDGDENTVLSFGPFHDEKPITAYFRARFRVDRPEAWSRALLWYRCDDGAVFYLNGIEIHRERMPSGPVGVQTRASFNLSGHAEIAFQHRAFREVSSILRPGENVLAVEVHQETPTSSDLKLDVDFRTGFDATEILERIGMDWQEGDPSRPELESLRRALNEFFTGLGESR